MGKDEIKQANQKALPKFLHVVAIPFCRKCADHRCNGEDLKVFARSLCRTIKGFEK